jgi:hypothetical protein
MTIRRCENSLYLSVCNYAYALGCVNVKQLLSKPTVPAYSKIWQRAMIDLSCRVRLAVLPFLWCQVFHQIFTDRTTYVVCKLKRSGDFRFMWRYKNISTTEISGSIIRYLLESGVLTVKCLAVSSTTLLGQMQTKNVLYSTRVFSPKSSKGLLRRLPLELFVSIL